MSSTVLAIYKYYIFHKYHDIILKIDLLKSASTMSTNNTQTIWVQDQPFIDWINAWTWVHSIKYKITYKSCSINLVHQKIRIENAFTKSSKQIDKLIKQD